MARDAGEAGCSRDRGRQRLTGSDGIDFGTRPTATLPPEEMDAYVVSTLVNSPRDETRRRVIVCVGGVILPPCTLATATS